MKYLTCLFGLIFLLPMFTYAHRTKTELLERVAQIQKTPDYHTQTALVKELGILYYYLATEEETYLEKSVTCFEGLKGYAPALELVCDAYLASLTALRAKYTMWPINKLSYANSALSKLDKVVEKSPQNIEILYLRAALCHNLPSLFARKNTAIKDCKSIASHLAEQKQEYSTEFIQEVRDFVISTNYLSSSELSKLNS